MRDPGPQLGEALPTPQDLVPADRTPETIEDWKTLADGLLSNRCCAFHRNAAISTRYAWIHTVQPTSFKWAAMAAIASHHVRLALYPLRFYADGTGFVDIPRSLGRQRLLNEDVNTIRLTNNAIYDDIFWVHLAYVSAEDGIERLRGLLRADHHYAPLLAGFETIDYACRLLEDGTVSTEARQIGHELIWAGNLELLEHEQRSVVQPNFDRLSCTFARLISIGSATTFEARGMRRELMYFTSFYGYSLTRGMPEAVRAQTFPRITRFEDRWRWLAMSVVPRFRRFDGDAHLVSRSLRRVFDLSRVYDAMPCLTSR